MGAGFNFCTFRLLAFVFFVGAGFNFCAFTLLAFVFFVDAGRGSRQLLTFFASPNKVSKKRRPLSSCPSGPHLAAKQNGKKINSLRSDIFFSDPFFSPLNGNYFLCGPQRQQPPPTSKATATSTADGSSCGIRERVASLRWLGQWGIGR